jgi:hypothetical protein
MSLYLLRREVPLALAALFIAFVIWLIAMQGERESSWVTVPIRLEQIADNMDVQITSPRSAAAAVNVQFPKTLRSRIVERNFSVVIPVSEVLSNDPDQWSQPGQIKAIHYNLSLSNVVIRALPREVNVIELDPDAVELEARLRLLDLTVEVLTTGEVPGQFQLTDKPIPQPPVVSVTGSRERLAALAEQGKRVKTRPIDLSAIAQSGQIICDLDLPEGVKLADQRSSRIAVNIGLQERAVVRRFPNVPIAIPVLSPDLQLTVTPPAADIKVEGPPSALNQITPDNFAFAAARTLNEKPGHPQDVGLEVTFRTRVPQEISRRLKITEVNPSRISVEFVPVKSQNGGSGASPAAR